MDDKELKLELKALQNEINELNDQIDELNDQIETIFYMIEEMTDEITYQNILANYAIRKAKRSK